MAASKKLSSILVLVFVGLSLVVSAVSGQTIAYAEISQPDLSAFPKVITYLDAFDADGLFLDGLRQNEITILENGQPKQPTKLAALNTPLNFTLAINSSPSLSIRDATGNSRYTKVINHLEEWVDQLPAENRDGMSLVWNGGVVASQMGAGAWKQKLTEFDPQLSKSTSSLAALSFALDVAQNTPTSVGVKKAILLVSGHLTNADSAGLADLVSRANQAKVRVFVLAVDAPDYYTTPGIQELFNLALNTGGQYQTYSGEEKIVYPEKWFAPLRSVYELTYETDLRQAGDVAFSVQVDHNGLSLVSQLEHFKLALQPPQVSLLSPPVEIVRDNPSNRFDLASFYPKDVRISVLIEYPDGKFRTIRRSTLFVDGEKAAENLSEPFTAFTWNVDVYQVDDYHSLQVEVEDVYGMSSKSTVVPVKLVVVEPAGGTIGRILGNNWVVVILAVIAIAGVLLRKVWLRRKSQPKPDAATEYPMEHPKPAKPQQGLTQPRHEPITISRREEPRKVLPWLSKQTGPIQAHLLPIREDGSPTGGSIISLKDGMVKIGSDPKMATFLITDRSVARLHARILLNDAGEYVLYDERSLTGTWVNYTMVYEEGKVLNPDDIVNFGNACYRFVQDTPQKPANDGPANPGG